MVKNNYEWYSKAHIEGTTSAHYLQVIIEHPFQRQFEKLVCETFIINCPVMPIDVTNAFNIFGPDLAGLRGKTVQQRQPASIQNMWGFQRRLLKNKMLTLTADIMFMNQFPFMIINGIGVELTTKEWIPNKTAKQLAHNIEKVLQLYS